MNETRRCNLSVKALVLRKIEYAESDLIVQVITDSLGQISLLARAARASKRRYAGGIEPFHGLQLHLDEPSHGELFRLRDVQLEQPRFNLVGSWIALTVAGRALGWVRKTTVARTPEPAVFHACRSLLDRLDQSPPTGMLAGEALLCEFGLVLLSLLGWQLELERCVRCTRACPKDSAATLDPRRGGLVCRSCGGARHLLSANQRQRMIAASRGDGSSLETADADAVLDIVEETLLAHSGVER